MKENKGVRLLAYITELVNQELLLQTDSSAAPRAPWWIDEVLQLFRMNIFAKRGSLTYNIYRCEGAGCTPPPPPFFRNWIPPSKVAPTFTDTVNDFGHAGATCPATATCYNTPYTYSATAVSTAGIESPYSNSASSEVTHLFVIADNQAGGVWLGEPRANVQSLR